MRSGLQPEHRYLASQDSSVSYQYTKLDILAENIEMARKGCLRMSE